MPLRSDDADKHDAGLHPARSSKPPPPLPRPASPTKRPPAMVAKAVDIDVHQVGGSRRGGVVPSPSPPCFPCREDSFHVVDRPLIPALPAPPPHSPSQADIPQGPLQLQPSGEAPAAEQQAAPS